MCSSLFWNVYFGHDKFIPWEMSSQYYTHVWGKKTSGHFCKFNSPCLMPICIMFVVELISQFYFVCHDKWQWNFSWKWIFHKKCWFFRFQWPLHVRNKGLFIEWIKFLENVFFMSLLINIVKIQCLELSHTSITSQFEKDYWKRMPLKAEIEVCTAQIANLF